MIATDSSTEITDPSGKTLFNIGEKLVSLHKTFVCEDESGKEVLRVKKHFASTYWAW